MKDRRMATKPHYKHSAEREFLITWAFTFILGSVCGALVVLGLG